MQFRLKFCGVLVLGGVAHIDTYATAAAAAYRSVGGHVDSTG